MTRDMKDSGIEWIGAIPEHWGFDKGKYHFTNNKYVVGMKSTNYDRLALTMNGVIHRNKEDNEGLQPNDFNTYQLLRKNELVFKLIDLQNISTSRVGLAYDTGIVSPAYVILHANKDINPSYAEKFYLMMWYRQIFNALGDAGVRSNLNANDLLNVYIPFPPIDEQNKIAAYLDNKCGEIDAITAKIQEQITTLEEYKKSVISEAVTKGLNPNAEMKDSGIEWIGKIPANWEIKRTKYLASSISKGNGITKEDVNSDGNIQCIRYGEIYSKYKNCFLNAISATNLNKISSPKYIFKGDILFAGTGELVEEIGKNIVYLGDKPCLAGGDIIILRHHQNCKFLNYALCSSYAQLQKSIGKAKLKVVHISSTDIGNIYVALPSPTEQQKIADYLDSQCSQVEEAIADKQKQIETLEEYKKTLIYEYVTGKKEIA